MSQQMQTDRAFAAIGCAVVQVDNIAKDAGRAKVGHSDNRRFIKVKARIR